MADCSSAECHLCRVSFMLNVIYAKCHLCINALMLCVIDAKCRKIGLQAECHSVECRYAECRGANEHAPSFTT